MGTKPKNIVTEKGSTEKGEVGAAISAKKTATQVMLDEGFAAPDYGFQSTEQIHHTQLLFVLEAILRELEKITHALERKKDN